MVNKCAAFFEQFFSWSFWSSLTLPRLVVLRCVVLRFVVRFVLRCVVLCCDVMLMCCDLSLACYSSLLA